MPTLYFVGIKNQDTVMQCISYVTAQVAIISDTVTVIMVAISPYYTVHMNPNYDVV